MHDPAELGTVRKTPQDMNGVIFSVTGVDDDGKATLDGELKLSRENVALDLSRAVVVMIVESDLTPGDHLWALNKMAKPSLDRIVIGGGVMGVHPY
jgi:hypothetical protein